MNNHKFNINKKIRVTSEQYEKLIALEAEVKICPECNKKGYIRNEYTKVRYLCSCTCGCEWEATID